MSDTFDKLRGSAQPQQVTQSAGSGSSTFDKLKGQQKTEQPKVDEEKGVTDYATQFAKDTGGTLAGAGELVGSLPGMAGAAYASVMPQWAGGAGDPWKVITGQKRATDVINDIMETGNEHNMLPITKNFPQIAQNPGYQAFQTAMQPGRNVGTLMETIGQNENMPRLEAAGTTVKENFDPAFMASAGIAGLRTGGPVKPGTMEWYNQFREAQKKGAYLDPAEARYARSTYPAQPERPEPPQPMPTVQPTLFDHPDTPQPSPNGPYDIPLEQRSAAGDEMAGSQQADMFSGYNPFGVPFDRYNPNQDVRPLLKAENTPGFLRSAIDLINLRFERQRQAEAQTPNGLEKLKLEERSAQKDADDITGAIDPLPIPEKVRQQAEQKVAKGEFGAWTQLVPIEQVWSLRDHNRLTDPKSERQWTEKEASVLKRGIDEPLEVKYSTADGKAVLTNGNSRLSAGMKHGYDEVPIRVTVTNKSLKDTEATNGVEVGKFDLKPGNARPEDIGLKARNPDVLGRGPGRKQRGGPARDKDKDFDNFMRKALDSRRNDRVSLSRYKGEISADISRLHNERRILINAQTAGEDQVHLDIGDVWGKPGQPTVVHKPMFAQIERLIHDHISRLTDRYNELQRLLDKGPGKSQRGGSQLFNSIHPKDLTDTIRKLKDTAPKSLEETVKDAKLTRDTITDFDSPKHLDRISNFKAVLKMAGRNLFDARTVRALTEGTPLEPIMTWVNQRIQSIDMAKKERLASDLSGSGYGRSKIDHLLGRRYEHHTGSPDGINPAIDTVEKLGKKSQEDWINTWDAAQGKEEPPAFADETHQKAFETIMDKAQARTDSINSKRQQLGKDAIAFIKNYFPRQREFGDYILNSFDKETGKRYLHTFSTMARALKARDQMRKDAPNLEVKDPVHKRLDRLDDTSIQALYDTAKAITGNDPLAKAVQQAIERSSAQRGAGGHFRMRSNENIGGYLGEGGDIKGFRKAWNTYMEFLNTYEANLDRALVQKEFDSLRLTGEAKEGKFEWRQNPKTGGWYKDDQTTSSPIRDVAPIFHDYATQYMLQSRGALGALDQFDKAVLEELGKGLQLGEHAMQTYIYKLNTFATVGFLAKTSFFLSQFFQHPIMSPPRMRKLLADVQTDYGPLGTVLTEAGTGTKIAASMARSYLYTFFPWLDSTGSRARLVNYAIKQGTVDPMASHMLEDPRSYGPVAQTFYRFTGNLEREVVRIPALIAMDDILRPYIKDEATRFEIANAQMFRAMAGTTRSNSPLLYNKLGPFGSMARSLKSYSTNWHGQLAEYITQAAREGDAAHLMPLAYFAGTNALFAGVLGTLAVPEVTAAINVFNAMTSSNVRTPQEWLLTNGNSEAARNAGGVNVGPDLTTFSNKYPQLKNVMTWGLASSLMPKGYNITQQTAPPDLTALITIVPAKAVIQFFEPLVDYAIAVAQGQPTQVKAMHLWQGLTLGNPHAKALIQKIYQQDGQPVPNASMNMGGNYYRDYAGPQTDPYAVYNDQTYNQSIASGMLTGKEKQADALYNFFVQNEARLAKDRANQMNSLVDDLLAGKNLDQKKLQGYIEKWGNAGSLEQDIVNTYKQRLLPGMTYQMQKGAQSGGTQFAGKFLHQQQYLPQQEQTTFDRLRGIQPRADGGPVEPGNTYLVGERGPETLVTPRGPVTVGKQGSQLLSPGFSGYVIPDAINALGNKLNPPMNDLQMRVNPNKMPNQQPAQPLPSSGGVRASGNISQKIYSDSAGLPSVPQDMSKIDADNEYNYGLGVLNEYKVEYLKKQYPEKADQIDDLWQQMKREKFDLEMNRILRGRGMPKQIIGGGTR